MTGAIRVRRQEQHMNRCARMAKDLRKGVKFRWRVGAMRRWVVGVEAVFDLSPVEDAVIVAVHPEAAAGAGWDDGEGHRVVRSG